MASHDNQRSRDAKGSIFDMLKFDTFAGAGKAARPNDDKAVVGKKSKTVSQKFTINLNKVKDVKSHLKVRHNLSGPDVRHWAATASDFAKKNGN